MPMKSKATGQNIQVFVGKRRMSSVDRLSFLNLVLQQRKENERFFQKCCFLKCIPAAPGTVQYTTFRRSELYMKNLTATSEAMTPR